MLDPDDLDRMLKERDKARREHNIALVKTLGMILGVCVTLVSIATGIWAWTSSRMLADFERQREVEAQAARLDSVEAKAANLAEAVGDIERVMELERVERTQEKRMLELILTGQGQEVPEPTPEVKDATEAIREILKD